MYPVAFSVFNVQFLNTKLKRHKSTFFLNSFVIWHKYAGLKTVSREQSRAVKLY